MVNGFGFSWTWHINYRNRCNRQYVFNFIYVCMWAVVVFISKNIVISFRRRIFWTGNFLLAHLQGFNPPRKLSCSSNKIKVSRKIWSCWKGEMKNMLQKYNNMVYETNFICFFFFFFFSPLKEWNEFSHLRLSFTKGGKKTNK